MALVLVTPPSVEPVTVSDLLVQMGMTVPSDTSLAATINSQMGIALRAARRYCENFTRSAYITQTWLYSREGFVEVDERSTDQRHHLLLPLAPFQSLVSVQYVDQAGVLQMLAAQTGYAGAPSDPTYCFRLDSGGDTTPAKLTHGRTRPWPPTYRIKDNVLIQFKCGFGGPIPCSMTASSPVLNGASFLPGDKGQPVTVPGAGTPAGGSPSDLVSVIQSVDGNGLATLAVSAGASVSGVTAWVGRQVPEDIKLAILFLGQFFYEQGAVTDLPTPRIIADLLGCYVNRVS